MNNYPKEVLLAFKAHRSSARTRNIGFELTLQEWWEWWQTDNRWANRGQGPTKLVMARLNDDGPYSSTNVYCTTGSQNGTDYFKSPKYHAGIEARRQRRAQKAATRDSMANARINIVVTKPQRVWLEREAKRLGIKIGEVIRRILDEVREPK